jgi:amino acid adenylation domain-containing protein
MNADRSLLDGFLASSDRFPERPALEVEGGSYTYAQMRAAVSALAATLRRHSPAPSVPLTAVLAERSSVAFQAVLACLWRGHGYVPLNPRFPVDRTRAMLDRSESETLIVDPACVPLLEGILEKTSTPQLVVLPESNEVEVLAERFPEHKIVGQQQLAEPGAEPQAGSGDDLAYLLFTSGSTGIPKGVMVTHRNVCHFVEVMTERYAVSEQDRFSHLFDLTFDLSVFDLFMTFESGACLVCPSPRQLLAPGAYVRDSQLTLWFSVPSQGVLMKRLGQLAPDLYPDLRTVLFCGEALTADVAKAWLQAAPHARVENLYGPTELTISCTAYPFAEERAREECDNGVVPIGWPLPGMSALVVDAELREVAAGESGELIMTGAQRTPGYWRDAQRTEQAYRVPAGHSEVYYRTGDLVRRPTRPDAPLQFLGRIDSQIKVRGWRVELGEIEAVLREAAQLDQAVALGWPMDGSRADGVVAFLATDHADVDAVRETVRGRLPSYMVPREIHLVAEFPLNANGKVDRKALAQMLEGRAQTAG